VSVHERGDDPAVTERTRLRKVYDGTAEIRRRYDADYFQGVTSGYSTEGYENDHPDWASWMGFLGMLADRGTFVDLGCAYGYLIEEARRGGYRAFGLDISSFALTRVAALRPFLAQAHLQQLPLRSECADLVLLFDVLEHLEDPAAAIEEAARVLAPEGFIVGATPDPIFFDRPEQTHIFERPPSFWIRQLNDLGFQVSFRFSDVPYNFQFAACRRDSPRVDRLALLNHDCFGPTTDVLRASAPVSAVLREGWGPPTEGARPIRGRRATVYLLNPGDTPLEGRASLRIHASGEFSTLRLRLNGWVLREIHLTTEALHRQVSVGPFPLPAGGHHLFLELSPGEPRVTVGEMDFIFDEPADSIATGLPFDLYQRYRQSGEICRILEARSVLDVGGYMGDADGHLAVSGDFLGGAAATLVVTTDSRSCDQPRHVPADVLAQPFEDGAFDLVLSLDVLEHIPPERREDFLRELDRLAARWILVGAPFRSEAVEAAERRLTEGLMRDHRFLEEHRQLGLPDRSLVQGFFSGRRLWEFPNGYLPSWLELQLLTQHFFGLRDYAATAGFNRYCNTRRYLRDLREPAYRTLFLVAKAPVSPARAEELERIRSPEPAADDEAAADLSGPLTRSREVLEERDRALHDLQFLANARLELIRLMEGERDALIHELRHTPLRTLALRRWKERRRQGREDKENR
jgi:SAM-dependent methyltransferase